MWRVANGAMRPGMLDDPALSNSMITIAAHLAFVHATSSPECLTAQAANTGEDVETLIMRLESAYYREHADVGLFFVLRRRIRHVRVTCGRGLCGDFSSLTIIGLTWYML